MAVFESPFGNLEKSVQFYIFLLSFICRHIFPLVWLYRLFRSLATNTIIKREISRHYEYNIQQSIAAGAWSNHFSGEVVCDCVYSWCVYVQWLPATMIYGKKYGKKNSIRKPRIAFFMSLKIFNKKSFSKKLTLLISIAAFNFVEN